MLIEIINVGMVEKVPTAKGFYRTVEIAYKFNDKVQGKKMVDFKYPKAFDTLITAKPGEVYEVEVGVDGQYRPWVAAAKSDAPMAEAVPQSAAAATGSTSAASGQRPAGRVTGSNYETSEERANRQRLIVRQSSLANAVAILTHNNPKAPISEDAVTSLASRLEAHVFHVFGETLANMEDDVPV